MIAPAGKIICYCSPFQQALLPVRGKQSNFIAVVDFKWEL